MGGETIDRERRFESRRLPKLWPGKRRSVGVWRGSGGGIRYRNERRRSPVSCRSNWCGFRRRFPDQNREESRRIYAKSGDDTRRFGERTERDERDTKKSRDGRGCSGKSQSSVVRSNGGSGRSKTRRRRSRTKRTCGGYAGMEEAICRESPAVWFRTKRVHSRTATIVADFQIAWRVDQSRERKPNLGRHWWNWVGKNDANDAVFSGERVHDQRSNWVHAAEKSCGHVRC